MEKAKKILDTYTIEHKLEEVVAEISLPYAVALMSLETCDRLRDAGIPTYYEHIQNGIYRCILILEDDVNNKSKHEVVEKLHRVVNTICLNPCVHSITVYKDSDKSLIGNAVLIPYRVTGICFN